MAFRKKHGADPNGKLSLLGKKKKKPTKREEKETC
jgi:hypothetical protein